MKKILIFAAIVAASLTIASCGLGTTSTSATSPAANASASTAGSQIGSLLGQNGNDVLGTVLSGLLGNATSEQSLAGTWTYSGPKIVFESENILSQVGGKVFSNNIESKLGTQLGKIGFTPGKSTLTLGTDNSCALALGSKSWPGTYAYDATANKMTLTGVFGMAQLNCTVSVQGNQLFMLFEADKLLSIATSLSAKSSSTLSTLLGSYSGLKVGWVMTK